MTNLAQFLTQQLRLDDVIRTRNGRLVYSVSCTLFVSSFDYIVQTWSMMTLVWQARKGKDFLLVLAKQLCLPQLIICLRGRRQAFPCREMTLSWSWWWCCWGKWLLLVVNVLPWCVLAYLVYSLCLYPLFSKKKQQKQNWGNHSRMNESLGRWKKGKEKLS